MLRFQASKDKYGQAHAAFSRLRNSTSGLDFIHAFSDFLGTYYSFCNKLGKELSNDPVFVKWHAQKIDERKKDELLEFLSSLRSKDIHQLGRIIKTDGRGRGSLFDPYPGIPTVFCTDGYYKVIDPDTPMERYESLPIPETMSMEIWAYVDNGPQTHLGKPLSGNNPVVMAELTLEYMKNLLIEADKHFGLATQSS